MEGLSRPTPGPARAGQIIVSLLLLLGGICILSDMLPAVIRQDLFLGDAAQHTWWTYRFDDPDLFPHDRMFEYDSLPAFSPYGYQTYMRVGAKVFDAQRLAETTGMFLAATSLLLAWRLGTAVGGTVGAIGALSAFIAFNVDRLSQGGFPRSFALPLFIAGMLAVVRRKWPALGLVLILTALFYPPLVLNLVPVVGCVMLIGIVRTRRLPRGFWLMTALSSVAVVLLGMIYLRPLPEWVGRWFTYAEARRMPEWSLLGRDMFFGPWRYYYFSSTTAGIGLTFEVAMIALAVLLVSLAIFRRAISIEAWLVLAVALGMWAMSHATLFKLYLPSRYTMYALPIFAILWGAGLGRELRQRFRYWINRPHIVYRSAVVSVFVLLFLARSATAYAHGRHIYRGPAMWGMSSDFHSAIGVIAVLPANTLVASHPDDANAVPLLALKSVLANTETTVAFNTAYYRFMKKRLEASFDLLYASDWETIDEISSAYGVKIFLLDRRRLTNLDDRPYFEPFRTENQDRITRAKSAGGFAMLTPPAGRVLFASGDIEVLRVGKGAP